MLVLTRRKDQKVLFPNLGIAVEVVEVRGKSVRLGVHAPRDVRIVRDELDCFPQAPDEPKEPGPGPMLAAETFRRQLDAANLALHLARNQMRQGLPDLAEVALDQALECLQSVDDSLVGGSPVSSDSSGKSLIPSNELAVHESRTAYATSNPPSIDNDVLTGNPGPQVGIVFSIDSQDLQLDAVAKQLSQPGRKIVPLSSAGQLVDWILNHRAPDFALMIGDTPTTEDGFDANSLCLGGRLRKQVDPLAIAGIQAQVWSSRECPIDLAS